ncbi:zinc finger protein 468-like isoform X2 [Lutzomyia longipalpis]|uniref:zinc finger protein 468-like isoform X2 n=1 Tax=Lutzomyia longipalpis TaxID=7200 RepID=UPI0024834850|nr:zinc finger protein 468-like isoform X2 [Lutzomyia longipalpis]XP_055681018.1 zinc finger protein 468-like isoform X2 [Lutzomyia longipalpis]
MDLANSIKDMCRLCAMDLTNSPATTRILHLNEKSILDRIKKYLQVTVKLDDYMPKQVCERCSQIITDIDELAKVAKNTQKYFLMHLNASLKKIEEKHEVKNPPDEPPVPPVKRSRRRGKKQDGKAPKPTNPPISLEQMINEQISKNPQGGEKCLHSSPQLTYLASNEVSIYAYDDLKLGQLIKDTELLKLILRTLKWEDCESEKQLEKLKNTSFRKILSNSNLLHDGDLLQLIKSYVGQDTFSNTFRPLNAAAGGTDGVVYDLQVSYHLPNVTVTSGCHEKLGELKNLYGGEVSVTEMEVGVDPELFLPYDEDTEATNGDGSCDSTTLSVDLSTENRVRDFEDIEEKAASDPPMPGRPGALNIPEAGFHCTTCPEKFHTHVQLQDHVLTHLLKKKASSGEPKSKTTPKAGKENEAKVRNLEEGNLMGKFTCLVCGRKLSTKGNLKVHMETHKPKGKYACDKCGRIFKTVVNLVRHKEYHSGIKFSCTICGRVYPTNSTLKAHSITHSNFHRNQHTGEKPYKCIYCPKTFASSGNCFSHRKRMHPEEMKIAEQEDEGVRKENISAYGEENPTGRTGEQSMEIEKA